jgi:hypothetical protein
MPSLTLHVTKQLIATRNVNDTYGCPVCGAALAAGIESPRVYSDGEIWGRFQGVGFQIELTGENLEKYLGLYLRGCKDPFDMTIEIPEVPNAPNR